MKAICQRCSQSEFHWNVRQAEFNIDSLKYWKVQLCESCTAIVRDALFQALRSSSSALAGASSTPREGE